MQTVQLICPSCHAEGRILRKWRPKTDSEAAEAQTARYRFPDTEYVACLTCAGSGWVEIDRRLAMRALARTYVTPASPPVTTVNAGCCV